MITSNYEFTTQMEHKTKTGLLYLIIPLSVQNGYTSPSGWRFVFLIEILIPVKSRLTLTVIIKDSK